MFIFENKNYTKVLLWQVIIPSTQGFELSFSTQKIYRKDWNVLAIAIEYNFMVIQKDEGVFSEGYG